MRSLARRVVLVGVIAVGGFAAGSAPGQVTQFSLSNNIQHIIVLMQENRSTDHYFARLHQQGQPHFDGAAPGVSNPDPTDPSGKPKIHAFHQTRLCEVDDVDHSWHGTHVQINDGKMDGFTRTNVHRDDPTGSRAMGYYDQSDLNFYYALYNTFATGDRYFGSVPGPTFPNRFYLLAGTSYVDTRREGGGAEIQNRIPGDPREDLDLRFDMAGRSIFNLLDAAEVSWKVYVSQPPLAFANEFAYVRNQRADHVVPVAQYFADAAAGTLPEVAYLDPIFLGPRNVQSDEHPPANPQTGQRFMADVINALLDSPNWDSSALFLTYDEHGGYFDHVAPPAAIHPDGVPPDSDQLDSEAATADNRDLPFDRSWNFDMYGPRVPVVVVSPFSRPHFVSHVVHDHTSILRFIELRFALPALTRRDAAADPMLEFFDFNRAAFANPPTLPEATIDTARAAQCQQDDLTRAR